MLKIAITDYSKYEHNAGWLKKYDPYIEDVQLSYQFNNLSRMRKCGGLILSAGGDVDPDLYYPDTPIKKRNFISNVYFGGTLIRDLGEKNKVHRKQGMKDRENMA